jgi:hypothetical protein
MALVHDVVPDRYDLSVADLVYALGDDRAKAFLAGDLAKFPSLSHQLDVARGQLAEIAPGDDLYSNWLVAIRELARPITGTQPGFFSSEAGRDLRVDSVAAAYGQLKHDYVLVAGEPYSSFGCAIPDGYVEPVPAAYAALARYAERARAGAAVIDPRDRTGVAAYFGRVAAILQVLRTISDDELAGRALTAAEKRWLGQIAEMGFTDDGDMTGRPPTYTGWYFDLYYGREEDGMRGATFIADFFTSPTGIQYVGATAPRLGVFVVDTNGGPRAMVGPVAHAYEVKTPLGARLTDETAMTASGVRDPWTTAYTLPGAPPPPSLAVRREEDGEHALVFTSDRDLGMATIKLLDHHRLPFKTLRLKLARGDTRVKVARRPALGAIYIEAGAWRDFVVAGTYGEIEQTWGARPPQDP